jgi:tetratricopeptide (TPR) repeat protein
VEVTPTPDLRAAEDIYSQAQTQLAEQNWTELMITIDTLRANYPDFEPIAGDGMYYLALRNRGVNRIIGAGELEPGIYDLNRATQIGPLDAEAENYRQWAALYIVAQSFWGVDWAQAVQYFSQIAAIAPSLHDSNFFTAQDRLAEAQVHYAGDLVNRALFLSGAKGWCEAEQLMNEANSISPHAPEVQPTAVWISEKCALNPDSQADVP